MADNKQTHQMNPSEHEHMNHPAQTGYNKHAGHHTGDFKKKFFISLFLTIPLVVLSISIQEILGYSLKFTGSLYLQFILATVLFFFCGMPFLKGAISEIKGKAPGMMTLISVAITVAYIYSSAIVFGLPGMDFFWELGTLISIMLLGHWLEMRSLMDASKALEALVQLLPQKAIRILAENKTEEIELSEVKTNDVLLVRANDKIPADGVIISGNSYLDESMLTGESKPISKNVSDTIIGGSINGTGTIEMRVTGVGNESYLSRVIGMVKQAQNDKSKTQSLADTAAKWLTYVALSVGLFTFIIWTANGKSVDFALMMTVGVMIIACPHALGLAIPLVVSNSVSKVAQNGVLIRNRTAFENSKRITTVIFDKTGTLTEGSFSVSSLEVFNGISEDKALQLAASLEKYSEHPIAASIARHSDSKGIQLLPVTNFNALTAKGIEGMIEGTMVRVLSPGGARSFGVETGQEKSGQTIVYLVSNGVVLAKIELSDQIRPESVEAVKALKERGIKVYMATGDNQSVAESVSVSLGLDGFFAELLPDEKLKILSQLQSKGEFVAMVGDGVNDAPALAKADVGIAIGSGTAVANETADIILINNNPRDVAKIIKWGTATKNKMIQNLIWATGYNAITIPLAAGILYPYFLLPPAVGAAIMSLSTIIVAINAQTLLRKIK